MQGLKSDVVRKRALRARICTICRFRPAGSETLPPTRPRQCEDRCPIFAYVRELAKVAMHTHGNLVGGFEHAIGNQVCQECTLSGSAGDFCAERFARSCPLSCYAADVLQTLQDVDAARH